LQPREPFDASPTSQSQFLLWDEGYLTIEGTTYAIHELGLDRLN